MKVVFDDTKSTVKSCQCGEIIELEVLNNGIDVMDSLLETLVWEKVTLYRANSKVGCNEFNKKVRMPSVLIVVMDSKFCLV